MWKEYNFIDQERKTNKQDSAQTPLRYVGLRNTHYRQLTAL